MMWRLKDIPPYSQNETQVAARHYNIIRVALRRLGNNMRFPLPGLRNIDFIIDNDSWVCADRSMNDMPIVAWTHFSTRNRGLHEPVVCQIDYYHFRAGLIARSSLDRVEQILGAQLKTSRSSATLLTLQP